jgi:hypothetical protein
MTHTALSLVAAEAFALLWIGLDWIGLDWFRLVWQRTLDEDTLSTDSVLADIGLGVYPSASYSTGQEDREMGHYGGYRIGASPVMVPSAGPTSAGVTSPGLQAWDTRFGGAPSGSTGLPRHGFASPAVTSHAGGWHSAPPHPMSCLPSMHGGVMGTSSASASGPRLVRSRNLNPSRHLWVGYLYNTTKTKIYDAFSGFGEVENVHFLKVSRLCFRLSPAQQVNFGAGERLFCRTDTARLSISSASVIALPRLRPCRANELAMKWSS